MLSPLESTLLARFARELRLHFGDRLVEVRLFGSRARGEGHEESDLDVCVRIRDLAYADRRAVQDRAAELSLEAALILSPVVVDDAAWGTNRIRGVVEREGVPL